MYRLTGLFRGFLILTFTYLTLSIGFAATNAWVPSTGGDWHNPANWSLGTLPNSSQSVLLDAPGWKAVAITPVTAANYPTSLTIQALTIRNNSTQDVNTLLLNYAGTDTPLRVLNGLSLQNGARIVNFNSGLVVDSGTIGLTNAEIIQDGGLVRATNTSLYLQRAAYYLTNGIFEASATIFTSNSVFNQYGGSATIKQIYFCCTPGGGGTYALSGGELTVQTLNMNFDNGTAASFVQTGGTNHAQYLTLQSGLSGTAAQYTLSGGFLQTSNTILGSGPSRATFQHDGGIHNCTQAITLEGALWHGTSPRPANYFLTGGQLFVPTLDVRSYGAFIQSSGLASVSGNFQFVGTTSDKRWWSSLAGGTLACSNLLSTGGGADFQQTGGALIVTNLLSFGATPTCCAPNDGAIYTFSGGTITASNIQIGLFSGGTNANTQFQLGSSTISGRISNPGNFTLAGIVRAGDANEQLGRFILGASSIVDLGLGSAKLRFAASSGQIWNPNATLYVTNWAGSVSGGGSDQLKFGNNPSGLGASQLQQIVFSNPAGLPPGNYPAQLLSAGEVVPASSSDPPPGPTNSWISQISGDWHNAANWSLGALPNSSQSVRIESPGWKAVAITPATSANFPASLTVKDLTIRNNSTQDVNTLLLNYAGAPLQVLNGLAVQDAARIVNFNSSVIVEGGAFVVTNAEVIQDGGLVRATNGGLALRAAAYYLSNGVFKANTMAMTRNGVFNQSGGSATIDQIAYCCIPNGGGTYFLSGGELTVGLLDMDFIYGDTSFVQTGGTNHVQTLSLRSVGDVGTGQYTLIGGFLETSNTVLWSNPFEATFLQNGGIHRCQSLTMEGGLRHIDSPRISRYILTNGQLLANSVVLRYCSEFIQNDGLASISGTFQLAGLPEGVGRTTSTLTGGTLACSNLLSSGNGHDLVQSGGALIVTNLLSFGGTTACCIPNYFPSYTFSNGTISASNIQIGGDNGISARFILGSSIASGRITNPGYFSLGGTLRLGDANEQLGRFILGGPSTIDFGPGNAKIRFAPSTAEGWVTNSLHIINWSGSLNGGGSDQLKFGASASGLRTSQLQQIVFSNPAGLPAGDYPAQILSTGEVVPAAGTSLSATRSASSLVLNWPAGWTLQSATNVIGPYLDVPNATPPYTNRLTGTPQRYFRLRQ